MSCFKLAAASCAALVAAAAVPALATHIPADDVVVQYDGNLVPGVASTGTIGTTTPADLYDWYKFNVTSGVPLSFTVTQLNGDIDPNLDLYRGIVNDGQTVADFPERLANTAENTNSEATLTFTPSFTGGASIAVSTFIGEPGGDYLLIGTGFTAIPEPATLSLLGLAGVGVLARRRR